MMANDAKAAHAIGRFGLDHRLRDRLGASRTQVVVAPANAEREETRFRASLSARRIGPLEVSHLRIPFYLHMKETDSSSVKDGDRALLLSLLLSGNGCLKQNRRTVVQSRLEIIICDANRHFLYDFNSEAILIKIPRSLLLSRTTYLHNLPLPSKLHCNRRLNAVLADLVIWIMSVESAGGSSMLVDARMGLCILDLVLAVIDAEGEQKPLQRCLHEAKLERAQRYIVANLADKKLCPERIARHTAVSLRTLNRLFAQRGTTPMRWVWQRRLAASHAALADGSSKNVSDVAFQFGFSEASHFCRSFKAAYGASPEKLTRSRDRS